MQTSLIAIAFQSEIFSREHIFFCINQLGKVMIKFMDLLNSISSFVICVSQIVYYNIILLKL